MKKILNSIFLISGTAIGSGLISLPLSASRLSIMEILIVILASFLVAYKTSCLTIDLMRKAGSGALSIVELSHRLSGNLARFISMISLYILSIALLSAYFAGTNSIIANFLEISSQNSIYFCFLIFLILFFIKPKIFNRLNSSIVFILLGLIGVVIISSVSLDIVTNFSEFCVSKGLNFLPIIFTSFGVQNICPFVAKQIGLENGNDIKKAFFIGILIPAVIYILWILAILSRIHEFDLLLYNKILNAQVDVGELICALCDSASFDFETLIFKSLSLFAIITSAAGTGIGLISSLKEARFLKNNGLLIALLTVGIPTLLTIMIPNAFVRILSFGGMIATIFVIFVPIYLAFKTLNSRLKQKILYILCLIFGILVIFEELFL